MVSKERVEEMLQEEIEKATAVGIKLGSISPKVQFPKASSFYGMCHHERNTYNGKTYSHYIRISEYFLPADEEEIRATIMHEVLHAGKDSYGHGPVWKSYAEKVNKAYGYHITRVGSQLGDDIEEFDLRKPAPAAHKSKGHCVVCLDCGQKFHRTRHSRMTLHPDWYRCKCGGKLKLEY